GHHASTALFDVGLTGSVLVHNLRALGVDASRIEHVVISHGHPDHYGGLHAFLDEFDRTIAVATHTDAFLPRYAVMGDGRTSAYYNQTFNISYIERRGGRPVLSSGALDLGCGMFTTGFIPRRVPFEGRSRRPNPTLRASTRSTRTAATASTRSSTSKGSSSTSRTGALSSSPGAPTRACSTPWTRRARSARPARCTPCWAASTWVSRPRLARTCASP